LKEIFARDGFLTAVVDVQVLDLHAEEDVIIQLLNLAVADLEVANVPLLLPQDIRIRLQIAIMQPYELTQ